MTSGPQPPTRYETTVRDVVEVALLGTAELAAWQTWLDPVELTAFRAGDHAELLLLACGSTYVGISFRELSLSVRVSHSADGSTPDAVCLVQARNTVRFFAWVERTFFRTPYRHGEVEVSADGAVRFTAPDAGGPVLHAAMGGRGVCVAGDDGWEGPIYLPRPPGRDDAPSSLFFGKLEGASRARPFDPAEDVFEARATGEFGHLARTGFVPTAWQFRTGAVHSRTKSRRRTR